MLLVKAKKKDKIQCSHLIKKKNSQKNRHMIGIGLIKGIYQNPIPNFTW